MATAPAPYNVAPKASTATTGGLIIIKRPLRVPRQRYHDENMEPAMPSFGTPFVAPMHLSIDRIEPRSASMRRNVESIRLFVAPGAMKILNNNSTISEILPTATIDRSRTWICPTRASFSTRSRRCATRMTL